MTEVIDKPLDEAATAEPLVRDLVAWIAKQPRPYADVLDAWRTSCPRLPVWETAVDRGLVRREMRAGVAMVTVTPQGQAYLAGLFPGPSTGSPSTGAPSTGAPSTGSGR